MDVHGVRQLERVRRVGERLEDAARRDPGAAERLVERGEVPLRRLPRLHAARIDDLDRVAAGGTEEPGHVVARAIPLAGVDQLEQVVVVAHQHEAPGIDARRVAHFVVRVPRRERSDGRVEHGGVAEPGVAIAGGEGARRRCHRCRSGRCDRRPGAEPAPDRRRAPRAGGGARGCSSSWRHDCECPRRLASRSCRARRAPVRRRAGRPRRGHRRCRCRAPRHRSRWRDRGPCPRQCGA